MTKPKDKGPDSEAVIQEVIDVLTKHFPLGLDQSIEQNSYNAARHISILISGTAVVCRKVGMGSEHFLNISKEIAERVWPQ